MLTDIEVDLESDYERKHESGSEIQQLIEYEPENSVTDSHTQHNIQIAILETNNMSKFDISTFNRIIPEHNGDPDSLNIFTRRCETYHNSLTSKGRQLFLDHLIFKLSGRAFLIYETKIQTDWTTWQFDKQFSKNSIQFKSSARVREHIPSTMGSEESKPTQKGNDITGQATSIVIEEGLSHIDTWHTILLVCVVVLIGLQCAHIIFRQYQRNMKKKYLERMHAATRNNV